MSFGLSQVRFGQFVVNEVMVNIRPIAARSPRKLADLHKEQYYALVDPV